MEKYKMQNKHWMMVAALGGVAVFAGWSMLGETTERAPAISSEQPTIVSPLSAFELNDILPAAGEAAAAAHQAAEKVDIDALQSHKALYNVSVTAMRSGAEVSNLSGTMFYEWSRDCDAWVSDHRSNLVYDYADGGSVNVTTDFSTYETLDGRSMSFNTRREQGGKVFEEFRGYADLDEGGQGKAVYTIPENTAYTLEDGTIFPMQHTLRLLNYAQQGKKFYSATIFDGSDERGPSQVTAFIASRIDPSWAVEANAEIDESILLENPWNLRLAFFAPEEQEEGAEYEMTLVAHENGVVSYVAIDYEHFSIEQRLKALEKIDTPSCE